MAGREERYEIGSWTLWLPSSGKLQATSLSRRDSMKWPGLDPMQSLEWTITNLWKDQEFPEDGIALLAKYLHVAPYLVPQKIDAAPNILVRPHLQLENIFVDQKTYKITSRAVAVSTYRTSAVPNRYPALLPTFRTRCGRTAWRLRFPLWIREKEGWWRDRERKLGRIVWSAATIASTPQVGCLQAEDVNRFYYMQTPHNFLSRGME